MARRTLRPPGASLAVIPTLERQHLKADPPMLVVLVTETILLALGVILEMLVPMPGGLESSDLF